MAPVVKAQQMAALGRLMTVLLPPTGDQPAHHTSHGRGEHRGQRDEDQPPADCGGGLASVWSRS